jgi:hypothetical protein
VILVSSFGVIFFHMFFVITLIESFMACPS